MLPSKCLRLLGGFGAENVKNSNILATETLLYAYILWREVHCGAEVLLGLGGDLSKPSYTVECSHEAGENGGIDREGEVKVRAEGDDGGHCVGFAAGMLWDTSCMRQHTAN